MLLRHAFGSATEGAYIHIRSYGRLSNLSCLKAKTKVWEDLIRDILFVDDAAVATHTQQEPQTQTDRFSKACKNFGLTTCISQKKTNVLEQGLEAPPSITIDDYELEAVNQFL